MDTQNHGVFVGRFQPFHNGHLVAIHSVLQEVDEVIIVVGSSQYSHRLDNPFTAGERITMIRKAMEEAAIEPLRYWSIPVPDVQVHMTWVAQVVGYSPKFNVVYTGIFTHAKNFIVISFLRAHDSSVP